MKVSVVIAIVLLSVVALATAAEEKRLIQLSPTHAQWLVESEIDILRQKRIGFVDITDEPRVQPSVPTPPPLPSQPEHKELVRKMIETLQAGNMKANLETLTDFHTRNYRTETGVQAAYWIRDTVQAYASGRSDITVSVFNNTFLQPSVIARIKGTQSSDVVIVGAHLDSTNLFGANLRSPGADDDGSGTVTIMEAFRGFVASGFRPNRTVEFHWYAAEEAGLLGSAAIAQKYANDNVNVVAMLQNDMTMYPGSGPKHMGIVTDFVNETLTQFVRQLVDAYLDLDWIDTKCGYGCSDHASWTRHNYRSSFPFEAIFSKSDPYIHTANDLMEHISIEHGLEFSKLSLSFAVELSYA